MKTIQIKKGHILQFKGDLNSSVYKVHSGLLRSYTIDKKGKEHIFMFAPEGWIIADSAEPDTPCDFFIDALEDATISITGKDFKAISPNITLLAKRIAVLQKRVIMLMSSSAIERYEHFIETYPDITQRVSQKMIASYLGITPEALSKVKGDQVRQKNDKLNS
ncbi:Crp/Fnr family transcriptional regulator [Aureispira anguillae]|uniref:Crp/Fnr family transcriptional regulator n=1 Tax=Aureispira anguillae TaxID=2864201 RepID=A0A916DSQ9_9BACT|nr:Crp/Fnr family transcriptional regulator [Aureispira anguillae]BDS11232.1 Crp/Fnr family transcriptional regulator [Aureispira anguillae]